MNNRGVSAIIVGIILVLMVSGLIIILANVLNLFISKGAEETALGVSSFLVKITLEEAKILDNGNLRVIVRKTAGDDEISGLKIVISDDSNSQIFDTNEPINNLESKIYEIPLTLIPIRVELFSVIDSGGEQNIGRLLDSEEVLSGSLSLFYNSRVIYLPFEGNFNDLTGNAISNPSPGITYEAGQVGLSANFTSSTGGNLGILGDPYLTNDTTIAFWINIDRLGARQNPFNQAYGGWGTMTLESSGRISWYFGSRGINAYPYGGHRSPVIVESQDVTNNNWIFVTAVRNSTDHTYKWYKDGVDISGSVGYNPIYPKINSRLFTVGDGYVNPIRGNLDEFMVFNKSLSDDEVLILYESMI